MKGKEKERRLRKGSRGSYEVKGEMKRRVVEWEGK